MPPKSDPIWKSFSKRDIENLLADLNLYSGVIREITDIKGGNANGDLALSGIIHTGMDSFPFSAIPMVCGPDSWNILLTDAVASLRLGDRRTVVWQVPKIHKSPALAERYRVANLLYEAYNAYSPATEVCRLTHYETILGYLSLPTHAAVSAAIVKDYRSFRMDTITPPPFSPKEN